MTNLESFIKKEINLNDKEVFPIDFEKKRYWVKKARVTNSSKMHKLFYFLFNIDILLPVSYKTSEESILFETNKIRKLQNVGVLVPNIIYQDKYNFVLEDCGETIYSYLRKSDITEDKFYYFINKILEQLAIIHNANYFHGGTQSRNFTYKDKRVYVIDFEESFDADIDIKTLQFRDLLLFVLSLTKIKANFEIDYKLIINKYISLTQNNSFRDKLKRFINQISFFIMISKINFIYNKMGTDLKSFFSLIEILKTLDIIDINKNRNRNVI